MSENKQDSDRGPETAFASLRDRPAPELDSHGLWQRIEAQLTPRSSPLWARLFPGAGRRRPALRLAYGIAAVAVLALAVWAALSLLQPVESVSRLVLLTPAEPGPAATPTTLAVAAAGELVVDLRLVRGYDGAPPADVRAAQQLGVGGADALRDVRSRIESLLPFEDFGVVGTWQGAVSGGDAIDAELSSVYRLLAQSADAGDGSALRLNGIELAGADGESVSGDLTLEPGRLYILGVLSPGDDTPNLVLLIRADASLPSEERR